jgi:uncharacterized protein (TIGR04551 family)
MTTNTHRLSFRSRWPIVVLMLWMWTPALAAAPVTPPPTKEPPQPSVNTDEGLVDQPFMTFRNTGTFRFRSDLFFRADLGNGVRGFGAPLETSAKNADLGETGDVLAGVNMRLRLAPQLSIGQRAKVGLVVDVLDNMVLGSTPDYGALRPDVPLVFLSDSQAMGLNDAIRVKQLWAEWNPLSIFRIRLGRMADHWGLGITHNGGECLDCDFGDTTDRASVLFEIMAYESLWFFDYPGEGATIRDPYETFGQAHDGSQTDDVVRWGFTVGTAQARTEFQQSQRRRTLGKGEAVVDLALRNTFTSQDLRVRTTLPGVSRANTCVVANPRASTQDFECTELLESGMSLWQPDVWARVEWWPSHRTHFRAEFEATALVGEMETTQGLANVASTRDFLAFGGVLQLELTQARLSYKLEAGFATGDDIASGPFGTTFNEPDDSVFDGSAKAANTTISNFVFDRDYHVDLLLYREVLGAVTNSMYVKPSILGYLIQSDELMVGGELSVLYGHALKPASTPGGDHPLGVETDVRAFIEIPRRMRADVEAGLLLPLDGLRNQVTGEDAELSFSVQCRLTMMF